MKSSELMRSSLLLPLACLSALLLSGCKEQVISLGSFNPYKGLEKSGIGADPIEDTGTTEYTYGQAGSGYDLSEGSGTSFSVSSALRERPHVADVIQFLSQPAVLTAHDGFSSAVIGGTAGAKIELVKVGTGVKLHSQAREYHALYVISGRAQILLDGSGSELRAGHFVTIPPGTTYKLTRLGSQPVSMLKFSEPAASPADIIWLE